jgi:hypothetical protein
LSRGGVDLVEQRKHQDDPGRDVHVTSCYSAATEPAAMPLPRHDGDRQAKAYAT